MSIDPRELWAALSPAFGVRSSTTSPQFWRRSPVKSELVKPSHLARKAIVYIRQSTPHQVVSNQESLRLQYALRQRARELGWHEADIDVIDADLGLSGASAAQRSGFKELVGRVGLSEVGLILSIDVTRLARNCSDWYPLLDICGLRGCLIADRDGVYDPGSANGRLLLGLKGTISELELHTIRSRLTAGLLAKAERGELALTLPIGLMRDPSGVVVKDPDMAVQERLGLVFEMFLKFRTVAKVMRVLNDRGLDLPRRDRHGDLRWARATVSSVAAILKNPAYAGAFVYGRTRMRAVAREGASPAKAPRPIEEWRIVVKDRYPAYIDWPTYEKIRAVIRDNRAEYMRTKTRGAPRDGDLLLHGIAWCARCGHKMYVRYKGGGEYVCNHLRSNEGLPTCQHIRAARIDAAVADAFLTALAPAELDALSRARRTQQQVDTALRASAERQLERKRYAAALAERQFNQVDPDNRLVAAELERRWEAALSEVRAAEEALAQQASPQAIAQMAMGKALGRQGRQPRRPSPTNLGGPGHHGCSTQGAVTVSRREGRARPRRARRRLGPSRLARRRRDRSRSEDEGQLHRQAHARDGNARSSARPRSRRYARRRDRRCPHQRGPSLP